MLRRGFEKLSRRHAWHGERQVDPVEERTRKAFLVVGDLKHTAAALLRLVAVVATGAGVHSGDHHEVCRVGEVALGAVDGDLAIFERLAK